jgi:hypothetical protein
MTAGRAASRAVLMWRIGWLTTSRWSVKTRIAARMTSNLLPAPAADPFIAIAVIVLIAAMAALRIARRHKHVKRFGRAGPARKRSSGRTRTGTPPGSGTAA